MRQRWRTLELRHVDPQPRGGTRGWLLRQCGRGKEASVLSALAAGIDFPLVATYDRACLIQR